MPCLGVSSWSRAVSPHESLLCFVYHGRTLLTSQGISRISAFCLYCFHWICSMSPIVPSVYWAPPRRFGFTGCWWRVPVNKTDQSLAVNSHEAYILVWRDSKETKESSSKPPTLQHASGRHCQRAGWVEILIFSATCPVGEIPARPAPQGRTDQAWNWAAISVSSVGVYSLAMNISWMGGCPAGWVMVLCIAFLSLRVGPCWTFRPFHAPRPHYPAHHSPHFPRDFTSHVPNR